MINHDRTYELMFLLMSFSTLHCTIHKLANLISFYLLVLNLSEWKEHFKLI